MKNNLDLLLEEGINEIIYNVFNDYDLDKLTDIEKRFLIFKYFTETLQYDHQVFQNKINGISGINPVETLINTIKYKTGVCNSFVMLYKFVLEKLGINAIACICNYDNISNQHKTILVKDKLSNTYSFDDITMVILKEETLESAFGYDLETAKNLKTPQREIFGNPSKLFDMFYKSNLTSDFTDEIIISKPIKYPHGEYVHSQVVALPKIEKIPENIKLDLIYNFNAKVK